MELCCNAHCCDDVMLHGVSICMVRSASSHGQKSSVWLKFSCDALYFVVSRLSRSRVSMFSVSSVSTGSPECPRRVQRLSSLQLVVSDELEEGEWAVCVVGGALSGRAPRLRRLVAAEPLVLLLRQVGVAGPAQQEVDSVPQQAVPVPRVGRNLKTVNIFYPSNIFSLQKYFLPRTWRGADTGRPDPRTSGPQWPPSAGRGRT